MPRFAKPRFAKADFKKIGHTAGRSLMELAEGYYFHLWLRLPLYGEDYMNGIGGPS